MRMHLSKAIGCLSYKLSIVKPEKYGLDDNGMALIKDYS